MENKLTETICAILTLFYFHHFYILHSNNFIKYGNDFFFFEKEN